MNELHSVLVFSHIVFGAIALIAFWIPAIARKGSKLHVQAGWIYAWGMYIVVVSAAIASLMVLYDPVGIRAPGAELDPEAAARLAERARGNALFLLMLAFLVFVSVRHGLLALQVRTRPDALRATSHRLAITTLGLLGVGVGIIGVQWGNPLLIGFAVLSVISFFSTMRETLMEKMSRKQQIVAHLSGLIGGGIGAHTAFFAFGGRAYLAEILQGYWQLIPWVLPSIIGVMAIRMLEKRYGPARQ